MKKIGIEEIKRYSLEVLCQLASVCDENDIPYSLTGGTLIGAVRHKGFIPWDDDIDVMIPRPHYDRLIKLASEQDLGFDLFSPEINGTSYGYAFAKASKRGTVVKENAVHNEELCFGVYVDIFPVDAVGSSYRGAKIRAMTFQFLHGLKITSNWTEYHKSKLRKWYYEPFRYVCYVVSRIIGRKRIDKMLEDFVRRKRYEKCTYAGRLLGDFGSKEVMKRTVFDELIKLEFEGKQFSAIAAYDTFLTNLYGDYMTMPPVEKRVSHHDFEAYVVE